ncbi:MAG: class I SAM-dependent methyltransferase [Patescibacteria group bacterium]
MRKKRSPKAKEIIKFRKLLNDKSHRGDKIKLHVGCGNNYYEDWINIDKNEDNKIQRIDIVWDMNDELPIKDNSVDFIYNEHFIEHLTADQGIRLMKDFYRVLKPGGVLRIATPDLDYIIFRYIFFWRRQEWIDKYGFSWVKSNAELINICFRSWGHQYLYNGKELKRRLYESGFSKLRRESLYKSKLPDLMNLETRKESDLIIEAIK